MSTNELPKFTKVILYPLHQGMDQIDVLIQIFKKLDGSLTSHMKSITKIHSSLNLPEEETPLYKAFLSVKSYLNDWSIGIKDLLHHLKYDIEEPLSLFSENIKKTIKDLESESKTSIDTLNQHYKKFEDHRDKYYKASEIYDTFCNIDISESNRATLNIHTDKAKDLVEEEMHKYLAAEGSTNEYLDNFEKDLIRNVQQIRKNEETRVYFIKTTMEKFIYYTNLYYKLLVESVQAMSIKFQAVSCSYDPNDIFSKFDEIMPKKVTFESYKVYKVRTAPVEVQEVEIITSTLDLLLDQKNSEIANYDKLIQLLESKSAKEQLVLDLERRELKKSIGLVEITQMAEIFKKVINELTCSERSNLLLISLLGIAEHIYTEYKGKNKYLYEFLIADSNLNEDSRWLNIIETLIKNKVSYEMETNEKLSKNQKSPSFFRKLANKLSNKESAKDTLVKKVAIQVLNDISMKMWKYAIDFGMAKNVVQTFAIKYEMDAHSVMEILSLLHQPSNFYSKKKPDQFFVTVALPFELALPYLTPFECLPLLVLKKSYNEMIRKKIYVKFLNEIYPKTMKIRKWLWLNALKEHFPEVNYDDLLRNFKMIEIPSNVEYVIDMDVLRSYQDNPEMQESLKRVLKIYSVNNPSIGYCQGMNFIAGTFLSVFNDEKLSFLCLFGLLEKLNMKQLLGEDMKNLRCFFYQLNKLIEIKYPKFYTNLVKIGMLSHNYSSSWFITLFSSCLQHRIDVLYEIWDILLYKGWKYAFRVAIHVLLFNKNIIKNKFHEENIKIFSNENLFTNELLSNNFARSANKIKVSSHLLQHLENDFSMIVEQSNCH